MPEKLATQADAGKPWRDILKIHPAAELFPLMSEAELRGLGENIKAGGGLREAVHLYKGELLDGRNRLDAMELVGFTFDAAGLNGLAHHLNDAVDPYAYVISANIHRRHLSGEQKRELIDKLLKAKPELSDRQIGKMAKADGKTVAARRTKKELRAEIPHVKARTDTKGRKQPASKAKAKTTKAGNSTNNTHKPPDNGNKTKPATAAAEVSIEQRKAQMAALDNAAEDAKHKADGMDLAAKHLAEFSAKQLAEFKHACNLRLPIMSPQHLQEAIAYCASFANKNTETAKAVAS